MTEEVKQVELPIKLGLDELLKLSQETVVNLVDKEASFFIGDKEYSVDVGIKVLSYDEVVNLMRGKDPQKVLMADLSKARVVATIFNKETKEPLFTEKTVGTALPQLIDALHKVSDEVNDFTGKHLMKNLAKKNSGVSSSSTELEGEQLLKPSEE